MNRNNKEDLYMFILLTGILFLFFINPVFCTDNSSVSWGLRYYNSKYNFNYIADVKFDKNNNVYITGYSTRSFPDESLILAKYDQNGNESWINFYQGPSQLYCVGEDIAVDSNNYIYVAGYQNNSLDGCNIWIRKYNSQGQEIWTRTHDSGYPDRAHAVCIDKKNYLYVGGYVTVPGQYENFWLRKYNIHGNVVWTKTYNNGGPDKIKSICSDNQNNIYVLGDTVIEGEFKNIWLAKYDNNGIILWQRIINGKGDDNDESIDLTVDHEDNVYLLGKFIDRDSNICNRLLKYNSHGKKVWDRLLDKNTDKKYNNYSSIICDKHSLFVSGSTYDESKKISALIVQYDFNGKIKWTDVNPSNNTILNNQLALDSVGNIVSAGSEGVEKDKEIIWIKKISRELKITTDFFKPATVNKYYETLLDAAGGTKPYKWDIIFGKLPNGLILDKNGIIQGTSTEKGEYKIRLRVTDANNTYQEKTIILNCQKLISFKD